jgi:N,N'-diacetyllegionaminate synthase
MKLISELCQNHNGNLETLESMIKTAAVCSDIVKIQTIYASNLTYRENYEDYRPYEPEYERLKGLELSRKDEELFIFKCMEYGVESMTTIFVPQHAPRFNELGYDNLKISGYSIPAFDYGKKLKAFKFKRLFFSTSSLSLEEIKLTIKNLNEMGIEYYMMQCTCIYPTPLDRLNLQNIDFYRALGVKNVGLSDHSNPHEDKLLSSKLAIFQGIDVLERHFTILDINDTRDGKVSVTPKMLSNLRKFSKMSKEDQYRELNKFNDQQIFNHDYYRERFK